MALPGMYGQAATRGQAPQFPTNPQAKGGWNPQQPGGGTRSGFAFDNNPSAYPSAPGQPPVYSGMGGVPAPMDPSVMDPSYVPQQNPYPNTRYGGAGAQGGNTMEQRGNWLKNYGYDIWSRPFDYDPDQFQNPYMDQQMGMIDSRIGDIQNRDFLNTLQDRATGEGGPSVAENQLQRTTDKNIAQQMAMGRSDGSPAAMRGAMYGAGDANQMAAGQAAELRAGEMQQATGQYMQYEGQLDDLVRQYTAAGMSAQDAQWMANMELENRQAGQHQQAQATRAGIASSQQPSPGWTLGGAALGAAGSIAAGYAGK